MQESNRVVIRPVAGQDELEAIFRLKYESYLQKGYISESSSKKMCDEWDQLPATTHFVATQRDKFVGAVRIVVDSENGLPMERVFPQEIAFLRSNGRTLAEASALVTAPIDRQSTQGIWLRLSKAVWEEAQAHDVDDLCIAVTQNHVAFYERLLFQKMGKGKHYGALNDVFAYPMYVHVEQVQAKHRSKGNPRAASLRGFLLETEGAGDPTE